MGKYKGLGQGLAIVQDISVIQWTRGEQIRKEKLDNQQNLLDRYRACYDLAEKYKVVARGAHDEKPLKEILTEYPDECWYCGTCYMVCPTEPKAITLIHPLNMRLALRKVK